MIEYSYALNKSYNRLSLANNQVLPWYETHILICDDSLVARKQMASALPAAWPVQLHFAEDGKQALAFLQHYGADVLFLDLKMPKLDDYGVLNEIKKTGLIRYYRGCFR